MGLLNSTVLEVAIGLIFVYLLLSIMCTAANEWVAALTRRRGETLRKGIAQLLSGQEVFADPTKPDTPGGTKALLNEFYDHPLIKSMMHDKNHPTYLSPRNFSATLTDIITGEQEGRLAFNN